MKRRRPRGSLKQFRRLPVVNPAPVPFHAERATAVEILGEGVEPAKVIEAADNAYGWADQLISNTENGKGACTKSCAYCCHIAVSASFPEIARIARALIDNMPAELLDVVRRILDARVAQHGSRSNDDHFRRHVACAFLGSDSACLIYPVRPLACRGWVANDVRECRAAFEAHDPKRPITINTTVANVAASVQLGLMSALSDLELDSRPVNLMRGVLFLLEEPDFVEHWRAGERIPDALIDAEANSSMQPLKFGTLADSIAALESSK